MTASVLSIGDELLIGQLVNTNAAWLGEQLASSGLTVVRAATVGDDVQAIRAALDELLSASEAVICTGGLGPTHDDLTRQALADALARPLRRDETLIGLIHTYYRERGRQTPQAADLMALLPEGFEPIPNPIGVAPGLWFAGDVGPLGDRVIAALPGVPREMEDMMRETVLPRLIERQGEAAAVQKTVMTAGAGESTVLERLGDLDSWLSENLKLAILPHYGEVRLRITALGATRAEAVDRAEEFAAHLAQRLGPLAFGEGGETLPEHVGQVLRERGLTLALAESCTGGAAGAAITDVPGSSDYFLGGIVSYSNESKQRLLGVEEAVLREHGAVSEPAARSMADGARKRLGADIGVSITGVAGPEGGTPATPVGTVWIGFADRAGSHAVRLQLGGDRLTIRRLSVTAALNLIRRRIEVST